MSARMRPVALAILLAGCTGEVGSVLLPVQATKEGELGKGYFDLGGVVQYISYTIEGGKKISGGDVVLDEELPMDVALEAIEAIEEQEQRTASFHAEQDKNLWKSNKIPYRFDSKVSSETRARVQEAIRHIEDATSVRFHERNNESDYVEIEHHGGCDSDRAGQAVVGRGKGGRRAVGLTPCASWSVATHELVHVLGGQHEHQRPDRDDHVKVHMDNVVEKFRYAFEKLSKGTKKRGPYTLDSIMHYTSGSYAKNANKNTISLRDGSDLPPVSKLLTSNDAEAISKMYPQSEPTVEYGGNWVMTKCSESEKDKCQIRNLCVVNKYGAYQWKRDEVRCPKKSWNEVTTPPADPQPVIKDAGSGCCYPCGQGKNQCCPGNCIWVAATLFGAHPYVDVRAVGSDAIIGSYHAPDIQVDPPPAGPGGNPAWVSVITLHLKTQTEIDLFASQGLRAWVVNPDSGKWSSEVLVKR